MSEIGVELVDSPSNWWLPEYPFGTQNACPCGVSVADDLYGRGFHAREHLLWACGVPVSGIYGDLITVTSNDPLPWRKVAYRLARLFQREEGYDFAMLPEPSRWKGYDRQPRAYVALWRGMAIGLAIVGDADRWGWGQKKDKDGYTHFDQQTRCPAIAGIFVCSNYRRRGVGIRLVARIALSEGVARHELAFMTPLSPGGMNLARRVAGDYLRLCGEVPWR